MDIDVTIGNDVTMRGGASASVGRIDQYELVRELGGGGFGCVYLAKDTVAGIEVAVKGLPPEVRHNKEELENIRQNFALVSRLHHPNIAAALVLHPAKEVSYANRDAMEKLRVFERDTMMVMEYAPGVTLSQWRKQFPEKKVPFDKALAIVRQVAAALDYAHGEKIVHRDVKPSNVMIETRQKVEKAGGGEVVARVLDFGLAAEIRSSMGRVSREIRDTSGTRPYMAPEQWRGAKQYPATDQYALAAMFCELVTGEVPFASVFDTGDPVVMLTNVTTLPPELPDSFPRGCRKALLKALAKKPEERFASCAAFVAALSSDGRARTPAAPLKWIAASVLLLTLAAGGGWWWHGRIKNEELRVKNEALAAERARKVAEERRKAEEARIAAEERRAIEERKALAAKSDAEKKRKEAEIAEREEKRRSDEKLAADRALQMRQAEERKRQEELARVAEMRKLEEQQRIAAEVKRREATEQSLDAFAEGRWSTGMSLAERGDETDARICVYRARCFEEGHLGKVDLHAAFEQYLIAAEAGDLAAQHKVGLFYAKGTGVDRNAEQAVLWCGRAAENGHVESQLFLARTYESGDFLPKDLKLSTHWYEKAAEAGNAEARRILHERTLNAGERKTITLPGGVAMDFVWCPAGRFSRTEKAAQEVTLTRGFWLAKTEVSCAQWRAVDTTDQEPASDLPRVGVTWDAAQRWMTRFREVVSTGRLRFPTEAEWEYASRTGSGTPGKTSGWCRINAYGKAHPVGSFEGNRWGLQDMLGNVREWCSDWYGPYVGKTVVDPVGPTTGTERVNRGGSWRRKPEICNSAYRDSAPPDAVSDIGLRPVLVVE